jgi:hypothetical protein
MTREELKYEVLKALDEIPDDVLKNILDYLKLMMALPEDKKELSEKLKRILLEDMDLLEKLAK